MFRNEHFSFIDEPFRLGWNLSCDKNGAIAGETVSWRTPMLAVVQNVLPVFLLILVGWLLVASTYLRPSAGDALAEFVFKLAVPVLLFRTLAEADFHGAFPVRLWIAYFSAVAVTWTAAHCLARFGFGTDRRTGTVAGVSSAFANNVFIGLPLVDRIVGPNGLVALSILIAIHLPVMMIASSVLMERAERGDTGKAMDGPLTLLKTFLRNMTGNPLMFGILGGVIWHLIGLPLAGPPKILVDQISAIAGPAALISLGMAMRRYGFAGNLGLAACVSVLKLFALPGLVFLAAHSLGLRPEWIAALVLTASVPTGVNAWLIASQFKTAEPLAASAITLTTGVGALTVSFWAWLLT
jgi:predicted permease